MASKARLARWVKPKSRRGDLEAPEFLKREWQHGDKNAIADLFAHCNFHRDPCMHLEPIAYDSIRFPPLVTRFCPFRPRLQNLWFRKTSRPI